MPSFIFDGRLMKLSGLELSAPAAGRPKTLPAPSKKPAFRKSRRGVCIDNWAILASSHIVNFEAFAVFPLQVLIGFGILEAFRPGIELKRPSQPIRNIPNLAMHAGEMRIERGYRKVRLVA